MEFKTLSSALVLNVLLAGQAAIAMDTPANEEGTHTPPVVQTGQTEVAQTPEEQTTTPATPLTADQKPEDPTNPALPSTPPPSLVQPQQETQPSVAPSTGGVKLDGDLTPQELLLTSQIYSKEAENAAKKAEKAAAPDATEKDQKDAEDAANALIQKGLELRNNGTLSTLEIKEEKANSWASSIWTFLTRSKKETSSSSSSSTPQVAEAPKSSSSGWNWSWSSLNPLNWGRSTAVVTEVNGDVIPVTVQTTPKSIATPAPTPEPAPQTEATAAPAPTPDVPPQTEATAAPAPTPEPAPPSAEATVQLQ